MDVPGPDGSRAPAVVGRRGPAGTAQAGGGARVPARFGCGQAGDGASDGPAPHLAARDDRVWSHSHLGRTKFRVWTLRL
jgi:hypothetical protein